MRYEEWLAQVPENLKQDPLWQFQVYPKALLLYDLVWEDCERLIKDPRGRAISDRSSAVPAPLLPTSKRDSAEALGGISPTSCGLP